MRFTNSRMPESRHSPMQTSGLQCDVKGLEMHKYATLFAQVLSMSSTQHLQVTHVYQAIELNLHCTKMLGSEYDTHTYEDDI